MLGLRGLVFSSQGLEFASKDLVSLGHPMVELLSVCDGFL